jgi:hypothetical protein
MQHLMNGHGDVREILVHPHGGQPDRPRNAFDALPDVSGFARYDGWPSDQNRNLCEGSNIGRYFSG